MSAEFAEGYDKATVQTVVAVGTYSKKKKKRKKERKKEEKRKRKKHIFRELSHDTKYSQFWLVRNSINRRKVCLLTEII